MRQVDKELLLLFFFLDLTVPYRLQQANDVDAVERNGKLSGAHEEWTFNSSERI